MTEAQAALTPIPDKRTHDQVEASPSTEPPPSSRPRHDSWLAISQNEATKPQTYTAV